jgi:hypothetical protein
LSCDTRTAELGRKPTLQKGLQPAWSRHPTSTAECHIDPCPDAVETKIMKPRRAGELMTAHFPQAELVALDWANVLETDGTVRTEVLDRLIDEFIQGDDILIDTWPPFGDLRSIGR